MEETFEGVSDGEIIRHYQVAIASGDSRAADEAFAALYKRCCSELRLFLEQSGLVQAEIEHILQEVWSAAVAELPRYEDRGLPFLHWLKKTAWNRLQEAYRDHQTEHKYLKALPDTYDVATSRWGEEDPLDVLTTRETRAEVQVAVQGVLGELSARDQDVFRARFDDGLSSQETADRFGLTRSNVDAICSRAREKLRGLLVARYGLERIAVWVGWSVRPEGRRTVQRAVTLAARPVAHDVVDIRYQPRIGSNGERS